MLQERLFGSNLLYDYNEINVSHLDGVVLGDFFVSW
jgi:hypothetical protein